jgi:hypothetical protein
VFNATLLRFLGRGSSGPTTPPTAF